jgi:hypothetical protein
MNYFFHPFAFLLYPWFRQWLMRAAFVTLTVAGQQGNFPERLKDKGIKDEFFILSPFAFILCEVTPFP